MNQFLLSLDAQFAGLHARSVALLGVVPAERLYWQPREPHATTLPVFSCGEHLLRGAATVEQTFGGINASLWDDPFEWTLPETLSTPRLVEEYLCEAEATRQRGFASISEDRELSKEIAVPAGGTRTLFDLILETLARASHQQGRAFATFRLFSDARLPQM